MTTSADTDRRADNVRAFLKQAQAQGQRPPMFDPNILNQVLAQLGQTGQVDWSQIMNGRGTPQQVAQAQPMGGSGAVSPTPPPQPGASPSPPSGNNSNDQFALPSAMGPTQRA